MTDPADPQPQPQPVRSVGRAALGGIGWIGAGTAVAKVASLIANFALGWLLAEGDYKLYAMAISVTALVGALRNGGAAKLLIQRREEYDDIAWPLARIALAFNLLGGAIVAALAWPVATQHGQPAVMWLMLLLAASFPLNTAPTVLQARLRAELRFKDLTLITMRSTILRYASMIAFAATGFGPFSFVLPQILATVFEWVAMQRVAGRIPRPRLDAPPRTRELLHQLKWVLGVTLGVALITNVHILVIGFAAPLLVGAFFFGFNLMRAVSQLFTQNLVGVVLPSFVRLKGQPDRQRDAMSRSVRLLTQATAPICLVGCVLAYPLVDFAWQGKWTHTVVVVQWLLLALPPRLMGSVGISVLESMGRWRTQAALTYVDAATLAATAFVAIQLDGGLTELAMAIGVQRFLAGMMYVATPAALLRVGPVRLAYQAMGPLACYLAAAGLLMNLGLHAPQHWPTALAVAAAAAVVWAIASLTVYRGDAQYLLRLASRRG